MIIFGTRGTYLKQQSKAFDCPNCGAVGSVHISFYAKYFHIFWIPIFPTSKTAISQCSNCKQALYPKEMPAKLFAAYQESSKSAKRPLTHFSGLFLIALFFTFVIISVVITKKNESSFAKNPLVGDVYKVKLKNGMYTFFKIKDIQGDTINFALYDYTSLSSTELNKTEKKYKDSYGKGELKVLKSEINGNINKSKIYGISRD
ncbi:zinc-ribbon domain-containing protein [Flavobacterium tegetincola]|uniref:zinc-ribbon domain-containing protein n=1 Tax=Flavobacterium tegetincola TaxID=150172 RepID=UPI0004259FA0|nr:zinc-ribbon domain-containing protein [Flavobacterium tegetincola]